MRAHIQFPRSTQRHHFKIRPLWVILAISLAILLAGGVLVARQIPEWLRKAPKTSPAGWLENISAQSPEPLTIAWAYRPHTYTGRPEGLDVLAPTWFYVEGTAEKPELKTIAQLGESCDFAQFVSQAHADGLKIWGTAVSMTPELSAALVHSQEHTAAFAAQLAQYVTDYQLDGVNFDFENMDPDDKLLYSDFIAQCRAALPEGTVLSVCTNIRMRNPDPNNFWQCYDHETLAQHADYLCVMAYDQNGSFSQEDGPVASLEWVDASLQTLLEVVPSDKVLLGVPFYGRDYTYTQQGGEYLPAWKTDSKMTVPVYDRHIQRLLAEGSYQDLRGNTVTVSQWNAQGTWMEPEAARYYEFVDTDNNLHKMWFDDGQALSLKSKLARRYHLAGSAVWEYAYASDSLWQGLAQGYTFYTPGGAHVAALQDLLDQAQQLQWFSAQGDWMGTSADAPAALRQALNTAGYNTQKDEMTPGEYLILTAGDGTEYRIDFADDVLWPDAALGEKLGLADGQIELVPGSLRAQVAPLFAK